MHSNQRIEMPMDKLISVYRLASLGKLMGGLVHNINGPLQNLGMDVEMANYHLGTESMLDKEQVGNFRERLNRMEDELDHIGNLVRSIAQKATTNDDHHDHMNLREFLEEELNFYKANLYFKHHVTTETRYENNPPSSKSLPRDFFLALSWFIQALLEELEARKIKELNLAVNTADTLMEICFTTKGEMLSEGFLRVFNDPTPATQGINSFDNCLGLRLSLALFKLQSASVSVYSNPSESIHRLTVNVPILN